MFVVGKDALSEDWEAYLRVDLTSVLQESLRARVCHQAFSELFLLRGLSWQGL